MTTDTKTSAELLAAQALASQVKKELTENILPYWMDKMSRPEGGLYGQIDGNEQLVADAPVGNIMTARVLWTFASAYRALGDKTDPATAQKWLEMAVNAKKLLLEKFYDPQYGGTYWSLNADYTPLDTKKQIYAIAFTIYGLAELNRATGDAEALEFAIKLFNDIEDHSFDKEKDGYFEAFTKEWNVIEDMRLSDKDANESKTMNTHLHVLEAYTCLYRVWKNRVLETRLRGLIEIFEQMIPIKKGDAIFVISFPRYSTMIINAAKYAKAKGAKVIVLTDKDTSPLIEFADFYLTAQAGFASVMDSLVAPLSVINAIVVAITRKRELQVKNRMTELKKLYDKYGVYTDN